MGWKCPRIHTSTRMCLYEDFGRSLSLDHDTISALCGPDAEPHQSPRICVQSAQSEHKRSRQVDSACTHIVEELGARDYGRQIFQLQHGARAG